MSHSQSMQPAVKCIEDLLQVLQFMSIACSVLPEHLEKMDEVKRARAVVADYNLIQEAKAAA